MISLTGKIAACEFHIKISREFHVKLVSREIHTTGFCLYRYLCTSEMPHRQCGSPPPRVIALPGSHVGQEMVPSVSGVSQDVN